MGNSVDDGRTDLRAAAIRAELCSRVVGQALDIRATVDSTNDLALQAGEQGAAEGLCVLADRQLQGRGRRRRSWTSLPGVGLYTSILLRPPLAPPEAALLTLAAGVATAEALEASAGVAARVKWPNDVLLEGRKVAGILTEASSLGAQLAHVVVGIGINVNHREADLPEALRTAATSLRLVTGRGWDRARIAAALYGALDRWYARLCAGERAAVLAAARRCSALLGRPVRVLSEAGGWDGVALDLDAEGALLVRDGSGAVVRLIADEVSIREADEPGPAVGGRGPKSDLGPRTSDFGPPSAER